MALGPITQYTPGFVDTAPVTISINTTDTLAQVTATGYLNYAKQTGSVFNNMQMALVETTDVGVIWLQVVVDNLGNVSLQEPAGPGSVTLPTIANHLVVSTNTAGTLANLTGTAINNGSIQAGLSGTAGSLISYPAAAASGSFVVTAVANSGNTNTVLANAPMGQASVVTIPDPANAIGRLLIAATATPFVSGNFPQASGTAGLMADSGISVANLVSKASTNIMGAGSSIVLAKVNGTEAANAVTTNGVAGVITTSALTTAGGASYVITWTNTSISATSVIGLTIQGGTNTTQNINFKVVPAGGSATLTIYNLTAATALNGTILIGYTVF